MTIWQHKPFNELSVDELYDILRLRQDIFVIEQDCIYPDIDGSDQAATHVFSYVNDQLLAYARIFAPGVKYTEAAIGRILTHEQARGTGLGKELMQESIRLVQAGYPNAAIKISAQQQLNKFYHGFGFETVSEPYDEDGIMHIDMLKS